MAKIAIVTSEGGMFCAYSVGAVLGLVDRFNLTDPDFVIGSSGSTGTLAYFVSKQYKQIRNIWENLLSTEKFVSLYRLNKIMDIDYLIDEVFKKQEPLDVEAIKKSKTQIFIGVTNLTKAKVGYITNRGDIFEALRASSAIPFYYGKKVKIGSEYFIDGAISSSLSDSIKKAQELGAEKIIAINNANSGWVVGLFFKLYGFIHSPLKTATYDSGFFNNSNVFIISPKERLPVRSVIDNNSNHLKDAIKIGYNEVMQNSSLEEFLKL